MCGKKSNRKRSNTHYVRRRKEARMNWDRIEGNWKQFKGNLKEKWGKVTDDEFDQIAGKRDMLVGKLQERYGMSKDAADREVSDWENEQRDMH
jgi:uncharacterized protein YjbJ (UPF0337 family)